MATEKQVNFINTLESKLGCFSTMICLRSALGKGYTVADLKTFFDGKKLIQSKVAELTVEQASMLIDSMKNEQCINPPLAQWLKSQSLKMNMVFNTDTAYSTLMHIAKLNEIEVPAQFNPFE